MFTRQVRMQSIERADDMAADVKRQARNACLAFLALTDLVAIIVATSRLTVSPHVLLGAVHRFLELFVLAFGFDWLNPKCHWLLHLVDSLNSVGWLLNCFVLERKHQTPKICHCEKEHD